eukprot:1012356-Rhodomonas_salina.1
MAEAWLVQACACNRFNRRHASEPPRGAHHGGAAAERGRGLVEEREERRAPGGDEDGTMQTMARSCKRVDKT